MACRARRAVLGAVGMAAVLGGPPAAAKPPPPKPAPVAKPAVPAKPSTPKPSPPPAPVGPLAFLPSVARVKVTSHRSAIAIVQEVNLPRGEWKGEALNFYVAFGAPGPKAIDAHLVPVGDGALEPDDDDEGEALTLERAPRRPPNAYALLGRDAMAGVVVHVRPDSMTQALARGNMAALRIRALVDATEPDALGALSVVVRLGASRGVPLTLGRLIASAAPSTSPLARVEARLCGPEADPHPLAVAVVPKVSRTGEPPIAPVLAVRHASDDLCLRLWHVAAKP